ALGRDSTSPPDPASVPPSASPRGRENWDRELADGWMPSKEIVHACRLATLRCLELRPERRLLMSGLPDDQPNSPWSLVGRIVFIAGTALGLLAMFLPWRGGDFESEN